MDFKEAYSFASELCSKQERCTSYVKEKLAKFELSSEVMADVLAKLRTEKFLDDLRYATYFTKDKYRFDKWGRLKIRYHLKAKQISDDLITEALEAIEEETYISNLQHILKSAKSKSKEVSHYMRDAKIVRLAASKGYEPSLIYKYINHDTDGPIDEF